MLKYLCHVTALIDTTPDADDLRGEPRWERNAFSAWLGTGRQVHTTFPVWRSALPAPTNLWDGLNSTWQDESILITHGSGPHTYITQRAKYYVVQYFDGPAEHEKLGFLQYHRARPGSILATCSYKSWTYLSRLQQVLGSENVECVHGPAIPCTVDTADNFNKPVLLWAHRNFLEYARAGSSSMKSLMAVVADMMRASPELRFVVNVCTYWDRSLLETLRSAPLDFLFSFPVMAPLSGLRDRVDVVFLLGWDKVLDLMSNTRLIVSPSMPFSAAVTEGAMYGVPSILGSQANPFQDAAGNTFFPELLTAPGLNKQFLDTLFRLYSDGSFYRAAGSAYRNHVRSVATYEAYINRMDAIFENRGWV